MCPAEAISPNSMNSMNAVVVSSEYVLVYTLYEYTVLEYYETAGVLLEMSVKC
jgi:hypothetical protein